MTDLRNKVDELANELGIDLNFEGDTALQDYSKGKPLTGQKLRTLVEGDVVWVVSRKYDDLYDDGPYFLEKASVGWILVNGSSFSGGDLDPAEYADDQPVIYDDGKFHIRYFESQRD